MDVGNGNGKRVDVQGWLRTASVVASVVVVGYWFGGREQQIEGTLTDHGRRLTILETRLEQLSDRQGQRVPLFDNMVGTIKDHEMRIRALELRERRFEQ